MKKKTYMMFIMFMIIGFTISPLDVFADKESFETCVKNRVKTVNYSPGYQTELESIVNTCATENNISVTFNEDNFNLCTPFSSGTSSIKNSEDIIKSLENCVLNSTEIKEDCNSLLGDPTNEDTVAWLLQQILNYLKVLGPLLVVVLSSMDFAKAIIISDDDNMRKAQKKLIIRLLAAVLLFFVPDLVNILLQIFGITTSPTCGLN